MIETDDTREPKARVYYLSSTLTTIAVSATNTFVPLFLASLGFSYVIAGMPPVIRGAGRFSFDAASIYVMGLNRPGLVLCSGIATTALGILICGLFPFAMAVNGANLLIGAGMAAFHVPLREIIYALGKKGEKGRAIGSMSVAIAVGPTLGILLGGLVSDYTGYRNLFIGCAAFLSTPFLLLYPFRNLRMTHRTESKGSERLQWSVAHGIFSIPGVPVLCACAIYIFFFQQATSLSVAFYATDSVGLSLSAYGLMRALSQVGNVSGRYLGGYGSDRLGPAVCLLAGFLLSSLGFYLLPWSRGFWPLTLVVSVIYVGSGLINVSSQVAVMSAVPSRVRGQAIGLYRAVGDMGMFLGPLVVTASLERIGFLWSFMWLGTVPLLFALLVLVRYPMK